MGMKPLGQSLPASQPGPLQSLSPVTITHAQDDTASTSSVHRVPSNTAAAARRWPARSPECRTTPQPPSLGHTALTYVYPAVFSATQTTGTARGDRGAPLFLSLFSDFGIRKLHERSCRDVVLELWAWNWLKGKLLKAQWDGFCCD